MPGSRTLHATREVLFTDLYELTMTQAYDAEGMDQLAVFELFFRKLPAERHFAVAAGLDDVLLSLEQLRTSEEDIEYLRAQNRFQDRFLERLRSWRFSGEIWAVPEGTIVFPNEPIVQVIAPIFDAQLIETMVLNLVHFQTVVASKAARVLSAAQGRTVVEFGSRRAHGADAALQVARVSYLVGAVGTSNVLAGKVYGIPIFGTMAHSYIEAHGDEADAFAAFARLFPETTLLVDTYDTLTGVRKVIDLARQLGDRFKIQAIRLDSGDLADLAHRSRSLLDEAGLNHVRIFASGGLDEYELAALLAAGAPIDAFGVGTNMVVSKDVPTLDMAYKLVEYDGRPRVKLSSSKEIYPGRKQVFREFANGRMVNDVIGRFDESLPGTPLLELVWRDGQRFQSGLSTLEESRASTLRALEALPEGLRALDPLESGYPVAISSALQNDLQTVKRHLESTQLSSVRTTP